MEGSAPPGMIAEGWDELLALSRDEGSERQLLERLLDLWCQQCGAHAAGLYLEKGDLLEREAAVGEGLPESFDASADAGFGSLPFPGGRLLFSPCEALGAEEAGARDPLTVLLAASLKSCRLRQDLKEQQFLVNYRVVELEALYDVGLAVASTLDLDRLSEEILLRAVGLLDARRGALYILEDGRYRLAGTFGGEAAPWFAIDDPELHAFLAGGAPAPANLLPGARYLLGVPIEVDGGPRGLIAVGDKESRRGVGPFLAPDRRTLALFANQAALALENARLHLQALEKERLEREMQLAELDPHTGVLHYMNAGHNPGILLRADDTVEQLGAGGLPLGLLPEARFQSRAVTLEPGDLLCLYSDGITEAGSPDEEEFGMRRLIDVLRWQRYQPLSEVLEAIPRAVGEFSRGLPQGDDQTLVLLRRE